MMVALLLYADARGNESDFTLSAHPAWASDPASASTTSRVVTTAA